MSDRLYIVEKSDGLFRTDGTIWKEAAWGPDGVGKIIEVHSDHIIGRLDNGDPVRFGFVGERFDDEDDDRSQEIIQTTPPTAPAQPAPREYDIGVDLAQPQPFEPIENVTMFITLKSNGTIHPSFHSVWVNERSPGGGLECNNIAKIKTVHDDHIIVNFFKDRRFGNTADNVHEEKVRLNITDNKFKDCCDDFAVEVVRVEEAAQAKEKPAQPQQAPAVGQYVFEDGKFFGRVMRGDNKHIRIDSPNNKRVWFSVCDTKERFEFFTIEPGMWLAPKTSESHSESCVHRLIERLIPDPWLNGETNPMVVINTGKPIDFTDVIKEYDILTPGQHDELRKGFAEPAQQQTQAVGQYAFQNGRFFGKVVGWSENNFTDIKDISGHTRHVDSDSFSLKFLTIEPGMSIHHKAGGLTYTIGTVSIGNKNVKAHIITHSNRRIDLEDFVAYWTITHTPEPAQPSAAHRQLAHPPPVKVVKPQDEVFDEYGLTLGVGYDVFYKVSGEICGTVTELHPDNQITMEFTPGITDDTVVAKPNIIPCYNPRITGPGESETPWGFCPHNWGCDDNVRVLYIDRLETAEKAEPAPHGRTAARVREHFNLALGEVAKTVLPKYLSVEYLEEPVQGVLPKHLPVICPRCDKLNRWQHSIRPEFGTDFCTACVIWWTSNDPSKPIVDSRKIDWHEVHEAAKEKKKQVQPDDVQTFKPAEGTMFVNMEDGEPNPLWKRNLWGIKGGCASIAGKIKSWHDDHVVVRLEDEKEHRMFYFTKNTFKDWTGDPAVEVRGPHFDVENAASVESKADSITQDWVVDDEFEIQILIGDIVFLKASGEVCGSVVRLHDDNELDMQFGIAGPRGSTSELHLYNPRVEGNEFGFHRNGQFNINTIRMDYIHGLEREQKQAKAAERGTEVFYKGEKIGIVADCREFRPAAQAAEIQPDSMVLPIDVQAKAFKDGSQLIAKAFEEAGTAAQQKLKECGLDAIKAEAWLNRNRPPVDLQNGDTIVTNTGIYRLSGNKWIKVAGKLRVRSHESITDDRIEYKFLCDELPAKDRSYGFETATIHKIMMPIHGDIVRPKGEPLRKRSRSQEDS